MQDGQEVKDLVDAVVVVTLYWNTIINDAGKTLFCVV